MTDVSDFIALPQGTKPWLQALRDALQELDDAIAAVVAGGLTDELVYSADTLSSNDSIQLTPGSATALSVAISVVGKHLRLPDATLLVEGRPRLVKNTGAKAFALNDYEGTVQLAALEPGETALAWLEDGADSPGGGTWRIAVIPATTVDQTARDMAVAALVEANAAGVAGPKGPLVLVDPFTSDSLDIAADATYDAAGDYYHNPGTETTLSASGEWTGATAAATFSGDDVSIGTNDRAIRSADTLTGDFTITATVTTANNSCLGVYDADEDATFNQNDGEGGMDAMTNSWYWNSGGSRTTYGGVQQLSDSVANGSVFEITRESGVIKFWDDGVLVHTFTQEFSGPVRIVIARQTGGGPDYDNVSWTDEGSPANPVYQEGGGSDGNGDLLTADPADLLAWFLLDPVDSLIMGTDVVGKLSCDGGLTWATGDWTQVGAFDDGKELWRLEADVSGQSGDTAAFRLECANAKEWRLHQCGGVLPVY